MTAKKKTLCILTDNFIVGGVELVVLQAISLLSDLYDITVFVLTGVIDEDLFCKIPEDVKIIKGTFSWSVKNELKVQMPFIGPAYFRKAIDNYYDSLIVVKPACRSAGLAHIARINIYWNHITHDVLYVDKELSLPKKLNKLRLKYVYSRFNEIWHVSDTLKRLYEEVFDLKNCYTIPNPIDVKKIENLSNGPMQEASMINDKHILISVGRLSKEKGFDRVIKALADCSCKKNWRYILIGDGNEKNNLKKLVDDLELTDQVIFMGQRTNPYPYIKQSDVLICPSIYESFGLVLLEAMVLRTPIIATRTIGAEYVTKNGKYGMVIDNTDESIKKVLIDILVESKNLTIELNEAYKWAKQFDVCQFRKRLKERLNCLD